VAYFLTANIGGVKEKNMRNLLFIFFVVGLMGCATSGKPAYSVDVDSLASAKAASQKTYLLIPGNEGITWDDLQFQEYAIYLMRVLDAQGYKSAQSMDEADVAIILSYGIGDPQAHQYSYSLPTWGETGVSSSKTYGTARTYGNRTSVNSTTVYTPSYGITGYNTHVGTSIQYFRYAFITGYDLEEFNRSGKQIQLWQTTITSAGSSGDLRRVFPALIGASAPYLATNTGKKINVSLRETDKVIKAVRGEPID
jgi:hypothetical protein